MSVPSSAKWVRMLGFFVILGLFLMAGARVFANDYYEQVKNKVYRFPKGMTTVYYKVDNPYNQAFWEEYNQWDYIRGELVPGAFAEWERALSGCLRLRPTASNERANIVVHWSNNYDDKPYIGKARPSFEGRDIQQSTINIALMHQEKHLPSNIIKAIALHEIGHALGLLTHSPYPSDIMYPTIQRNVSSLSEQDINTMRMVYCR